jgi:RHS repeat-associated protein
MQSFDGQALTYDSNGNLTGDGTNTYTWDGRNHLIAISSGSTASFTYDGFGRRVQKVIGGTTTQFLYDGLNPVQELNGRHNPAVIANLLTGLGIDEYLTRTDTSTGVTSTLLTDALGSTIGLVTANNGPIATNYTYQPFGGTTAGGSANGNSYEFTGRENDGTGLYFYRARYYSPTFQRFVSQDPIGFGGGDANLYSYSANQPTLLSDPSGLDFIVGGGGELILYNDNGIPLGIYPYTSGRNGDANPADPWSGPIPPGEYILLPSKISPSGFFRKYLDPRDWGDYRVRLYEAPGTKTFGRSEFFLHGGHKRPGSAGCIKVGGPNQDDLFQQLQRDPDPVVPVYVR